MADDMDKEYRALMDSKGEDTPTEHEEAASQVEHKQADQSAAPQPDAAQSQDALKADPAKAAEPEKAAAPDIGEEAKKHIDNMKAQAREEREKRRAEAARAEAAEQRAAQLEANMRQLMAQVQQNQQKAPDPEVDVVAALKFTQAQLAQAQQRQAAEAQQRAVLAQQNQVATTIKNKVEDFEAEFKADNPDYDDALEYVLDTKEAEFELAGYPKDMAKQHAARWAMNAAAAMLQTGKNPAEQGYALAKRMGYAPKQPTPDPAVIAAQQANAQKLANIKDGQQATSKMAGGGTSSTFGGSLKEIANLEGAAFDSASEKFLRQMTRG